MEFKAVPRTIADTLDLKRKYVIPRFQREYSWENDELQELWDDLLDCFTVHNGKLYPNEYFIGTLVLVGDDDDNMNIKRQVVDGQQRLMTITIAFSVIRKLFLMEKEETLANKVYSYIMGEDADGVEYAKLETETPKPYFQMRIQKREQNENILPNTDEEKRILNAYNYFERKLSRKNILQEIKKRYRIDDNRLDYIELLKLFRDQILHCKVIYVTVKSFDDAYAIFEVLNAKGKDLSPIDIIKNSLFSILNETEPVDFAEESWKKIKRKTVGKCDIQTFYRHYWLSKYGYSTAKKLVKEFNDKIGKNQSEYTIFLKELVEASEDYYKIVYPNKNDWSQPEEIDIYYALEACDIFDVTQVRIFLLALFDVKRKKMISHKQFLRIIKFLEQYHFVFNSICSMRPSGLERRYSSYARKLRICKDKNETKKCIDELIATLKEGLPAKEIFVSNFVNVRYTSDFAKDKKFWDDQLDALGEPLYSDIQGPAVLEEARKRHGNPKLRASDIEMNELFVAVKDYHLEPYATQNLMDFCMNHQLSMTNLLLLGIRTYLSKVNNGQEDITIQNFISRRSTHEEWTSGGSRTIMFPCRTVISPETDFLSAAYEIQNMQNRIYMHSNYDPAFIVDEMRKRYHTPEHTSYESCYLTYQPMPVKVENEMLGTIRQHAKWFANGAATKKMYLTVSHTEDGGMNFSYHYQTAHLEEHDMELLYYYMMRILFKGIAEPDMSIGEIMEQV